MDIPNSIIEAVKEPLAQPKPKARKPYARKLTKRILQAIGSGLRTSASIAKALDVDKARIQSNLHHIKNRGLVHATKQKGKVELKYHLPTETAKPKARKPYTKRVAKVAKVAKAVTVEVKPTLMLGQYAKELEVKISSITSKLAYLEQSLTEKEKEVWTLECEVFDKKAIIKYLEEKLFALGVRV